LRRADSSAHGHDTIRPHALAKYGKMAETAAHYSQIFNSQFPHKDDHLILIYQLINGLINSLITESEKLKLAVGSYYELFI
jgi:hypothetical protein